MQIGEVEKIESQQDLRKCSKLDNEEVNCVSLPSTNAELVTLSAATTEPLHIKKFLE